MGDIDYVSASITADRSCAVVYLPHSTAITVNMAFLSSVVRARWYDPVSGDYQETEKSGFRNIGVFQFQPPDKNAGGDSDFVLLLQTEKGLSHVKAARSLEKRGVGLSSIFSTN